MAIDDAAAWLICPPRSITWHGYAPWLAATAYAQGAIVRGKAGGAAANELYMALAAGTSAGTAGPVHTSGEVLDGGGGVLWLYVPQLPRAGAAVVNDSDVVVYVALENAVASGKGARLNAYGGTYAIPKGDLQKSLYAIVVSSGGSGKNLSIQEW
jgi:hypothetical protein